MIIASSRNVLDELISEVEEFDIEKLRKKIADGEDIPELDLEEVRRNTSAQNWLIILERRLYIKEASLRANLIETIEAAKKSNDFQAKCDAALDVLVYFLNGK